MGTSLGMIAGTTCSFLTGCTRPNKGDEIDDDPLIEFLGNDWRKSSEPSWAAERLDNPIGPDNAARLCNPTGVDKFKDGDGRKLDCGAGADEVIIGWIWFLIWFNVAKSRRWEERTWANWWKG